MTKTLTKTILAAGPNDHNQLLLKLLAPGPMTTIRLKFIKENANSHSAHNHYP